MAVSRTFIYSILLAILYANAALSTRPTTRQAVHLVRELEGGILVEAFHPASTYQTFGKGLESHSFSSFSSNTLKEKTVSFVSAQLKVDPSAVTFSSGFGRESGDSFGYVNQVYQGIPVVNAHANVAFKNDKVVAFGASFVSFAKAADPTPTVPLGSTLAKIEEILRGKKNEIEPTLRYLARPDGSLALVHSLQVRNIDTDTWYEAYVDAHTGDLLSVVDFGFHYSYRAIPIGSENPDDGFQLINNPPVLSNASPSGWHDGDGTTTSGNNVLVYKGIKTNVTSESSPGVFDYIYNPTEEPATPTNVDAGRTNAFYIANSYHDTLYQYGFTEAAFNFQNDNFGKGGVGDDRVLVYVQNPKKTNNAGFYSPPDGQSGELTIYRWTNSVPDRDGALENGLVIHELTHGLTNRLTSGGTSSGCLSSPVESAGLGEGWSDAVADWFWHTSHEDIQDYAVSPWVKNSPAGIRTFLYSTSNVTNPLLYSDVGKRDEAHRIGEVWANILHNIYAKLVDSYGWSPTARTSATGSEGNVVFLQILVDALSLQPCHPTFVHARDAWIQAGGEEHMCLLWEVFASRGLGVGATSDYMDSFGVPSDCVGGVPSECPSAEIPNKRRF